MSWHFLFPDRTCTDYAFLAAHPDGLGILDFEFVEGGELANRFPVGAEYEMDSESPDARTLYDVQPNALGVLIVSDRTKNVIEAAGAPCVEFLPIRILDHRGRPAGDPYHIARTTDFVDCLDTGASIVEDDPLDEDAYGTIEKLVIDPARVPADRALFRIARLPRLFVVSDALRTHMVAEGLRGIAFVAPETYSSALY